MSSIYRIMLDVEMFTNRTSYEFRVRKFKCNNITEKNYLIDGRRIKKEEIDKVQTGRFVNSTRNIGFEVWTLDESKIEYFKPILIDRIKNAIKNYREDLSNLETSMTQEPIYSFRDMDDMDNEY